MMILLFKPEFVETPENIGSVSVDEVVLEYTDFTPPPGRPRTLILKAFQPDFR